MGDTSKGGREKLSKDCHRQIHRPHIVVVNKLQKKIVVTNVVIPSCRNIRKKKHKKTV